MNRHLYTPRPWQSFMAMAACLLFTGDACAQSLPSDAQRDAWSRALEKRTFSFPDNYSGLHASLRQFSADAKVHVVFYPAKKWTLEFHFTRDQGEPLRLTGHDQSAFVTCENVLYFADYPPDSEGCNITAYDLATGKELWKTDLHQPRPAAHSGYRNLVALTLAEAAAIEGGSDGDAIIVTGRESFCDYVEVLDRKTGASLAMKAYRQGFVRSNPGGVGFGGTNGFKEP